MIRLAALSLTVLTGFSGLVYEVTWEKALATLLGSHAEATAAVLGLFLGGLALGYALFGRFTQRRLERAAAAGQPPRLLVAYGWLESGIGLVALAFPLTFGAVQALSFAIPPMAEGLAFAIDVFLSLLLIGPPAVLMGGTIPILTQALAHDLEDATRVHAWVYSFNTFGAFVGALAAGFWLIPSFGIQGTLFAMAFVNLLVGATFLVLGRHDRSGMTRAVPASAAPVQSDSDFPVFVVAALAVGFAMMTVQTVLIRLGAMSFGASQFTFSMVVAVFVLCIALGSLLVSALPRIPRWLVAADLWALLTALLILYPLLPDAPYWVHRLRVEFPLEPSAFYAYYLAACAGVFVVIGVPVILSGALLPLLFDHLRSRVGELGDMAGRLYSANTAGSLLGALLGGYLLLFWLDLEHVFRLALLAVALAAVLVTGRLLDPARRRWAHAAVIAPALLILVLPSWPAERLAAGLFRLRTPVPETRLGPDRLFAVNVPQIPLGQKLRSYEDDPFASIAVFELPLQDGGVELNIVTNGKSDGMLVADRLTTAMLALVPALLADRVETAFVIGYGTGVTVGTLAAIRSMREITVAELSPGVMQAARFFEEGNGGALAFPGTRIVRSDAFRALLRSEEQFDLIISGPSNPWVSGVEMLYSQEFLAAARDRLSAGGVHCQWLHEYETDDETVAMILRGYAAVFDHVAVWYAAGPDLLLLGFRDEVSSLDLDRIRERFERKDFREQFRRVGIHSLPVLLSHELLPLGTLAELDLEGPLHTLLHPRLNHQAARAFFAGLTGRLPTAAERDAARTAGRNSLIQRYAARYRGRLTYKERRQFATEVCRHRERVCLTYLAHWEHEEPGSAGVKRVIEQIRKRRKTPKLGIEEGLVELQRLYATGSEPVSVEAAWRISSNFLEFYYHAAPFPRDQLAALWDRCEAEVAPGRISCEQGRKRVSDRLGPLESTASNASP